MEHVKAIITGVTGMVGKGVLFECLENQNVESVLVINRRYFPIMSRQPTGLEKP